MVSSDTLGSYRPARRNEMKWFDLFLGCWFSSCLQISVLFNFSFFFFTVTFLLVIFQALDTLKLTCFHRVFFSEFIRPQKLFLSTRSSGLGTRNRFQGNKKLCLFSPLHSFGFHCFWRSLPHGFMSVGHEWRRSRVH